MQVGVILPSFAPRAEPCLAAARDAEAAGIHGVFLYDHIWPLGHPEQPALLPFPLLGALCAATDRVKLGTLVARVGLVQDALLLGQLCSLAHLSDGRLIAGLGTGDRASAAENLAYGIDFARASQRRDSMSLIVQALLRCKIATWVGGGSRATNDLARKLGVPLNLWQATPAAIQAAAQAGPVTWAGSFPREEQVAREQLIALERAGATWAVYAWPGSAAPLVGAARAAGIDLAD